MSRGQSTAEAIFAVVVLLVLLAVVFVMAMQKNTAAVAVEETSRDSLECSRIAGLITDMHINAEKTSVRIVAMRDSQIIRKTQGSETARYVVVGDVFCQYFGTVQNEDIGVDLEMGEVYYMEKENGGVEFCLDAPCP